MEVKLIFRNACDSLMLTWLILTSILYDRSTPPAV